MDELKDYWYSLLKEVPDMEFYNYCINEHCLCTSAIASVIDEKFFQNFDLEQRTILNSIAFMVIEEEIGPLLFNLRRASYPSQDHFDSDQMYELEQMIKVATHFEINFIATILKEAKSIHTKTKSI